jgi:predicted RNase H-like HicB family nuclease
MDENILRQAEKLAKRNYSILVSVDKLSTGKDIFLAKNPELFGCMAQGLTIEEAVDNLLKARIDYIYDSIEDNIVIPDPAPEAVKTFDDADIMEIESFKIEKHYENMNVYDNKQLYEALIES